MQNILKSMQFFHNMQFHNILKTFNVFKKNTNKRKIWREKNP